MFNVVHCMPHVPQFCGSVLVLVQTPLHFVAPAGQLHAPDTHFSPPEQARPQLPQFCGSTWRFTHARAHIVVPVQVSMQLPLRQTWLALHRVPHAPQLLGSDAVHTHTPEQLVGVPRLMTASQPQTPPEQTCPLGQLTPHPPQLPALVAVSTQAPPQEVVPPGQVAIHAPFAHT
jgi:hypothetical protein